MQGGGGTGQMNGTSSVVTLITSEEAQTLGTHVCISLQRLSEDLCLVVDHNTRLLDYS